MNSLFRNENPSYYAHDMIRKAIVMTKKKWEPPELGLVTFVDPRCVPGVMVRGKRIYGFSYMKAGFRHVGFTKQLKLWVWQILPKEMPSERSFDEQPRG